MSEINPYTIIPNELKANDILAYKIVAVIGRTGEDWAAYRGPSSDSNHDIALFGEKIPKEVAEKLFYAPTSLGLRYRE